MLNATASLQLVIPRPQVLGPQWLQDHPATPVVCLSGCWWGHHSSHNPGLPALLLDSYLCLTPQIPEGNCPQTLLRPSPPHTSSSLKNQHERLSIAFDEHRGLGYWQRGLHSSYLATSTLSTRSPQIH